MKRAAILIGVSKTAILQQLQAVEASVKAMKLWADTQHFAYVKTLTDEKRPLQIQQIKDVIREVVEATTYEQLIVYFAGHGVNIGTSERWLLSDAPADTGAAVNVPGGETLARSCGIPHVVFISDACRTVAEGIQAQAVTGSDIFPNLAEGSLEQPGDLFFACTLGSPALEIKDAQTANSLASAFPTRYRMTRLNRVPSASAIGLSNSKNIGIRFAFPGGRVLTSRRLSPPKSPS